MFYHSIFRINHKKEYARLHGYVKVTRYATSLVKITGGGRLILVLLQSLRLWPVDKKELLRGSRESGIEPMNIVGSEHIVGHIALVEINMCPLSTLRLMTRYGIGELHLQSIIVFVGAHMLHAVGFQGDVGIVGKHAVKELFALFVC